MGVRSRRALPPPPGQLLRRSRTPISHNEADTVYHIRSPNHKHQEMPLPFLGCPQHLRRLRFRGHQEIPSGQAIVPDFK